jgi:hypothetical protein
MVKSWSCTWHGASEPRAASITRIVPGAHRPAELGCEEAGHVAAEDLRDVVAGEASAQQR